MNSWVLLVILGCTVDYRPCPGVTLSFATQQHCVAALRKVRKDLGSRVSFSQCFDTGSRHRSTASQFSRF